jgi:hypothetical protein
MEGERNRVPPEEYAPEPQPLTIGQMAKLLAALEESGGWLPGLSSGGLPPPELLAAYLRKSAELTDANLEDLRAQIGALQRKMDAQQAQIDALEARTGQGHWAVEATGDVFALPPPDETGQIVPFIPPEEWLLGRDPNTSRGGIVRRLAERVFELVDTTSSVDGIYPMVAAFRPYDSSPEDIRGALKWPFSGIEGDVAVPDRSYFNATGAVATLDPLRKLPTGFGRNTQRVEYDPDRNPILQMYLSNSDTLSPELTALAVMFAQRENAARVGEEAEKGKTVTTPNDGVLARYLDAWEELDKVLGARGSVQYQIGRLVVEGGGIILAPIIDSGSWTLDAQMYETRQVTQMSERQFGESGVSQDITILVAQIFIPLILSITAITVYLRTRDPFGGFGELLGTVTALAAVAVGVAAAIWGSRVSENEGFDALDCGGAAKNLSYPIRQAGQR